MRIFILAVLFCLQALVAAAANIPLMPVRDIKPGMQGVGKTVISGDTIEEFNVEVLGVTGSETTGRNILVRLYGPLIDKTGGVAQGMSGSPVFIDGRLVGAVSHGRLFDDAHYCYLRPIGEMLRLLNEPRQLPAGWLPQGTSLLASGFSDFGMSYLQEQLAPLGLEAVPGGAGAAVSSKKLEPGSAMGVAMMQGDLALGAMGTVTWTDDAGNILAFGHPFMQRGASNFFLNKAWILGVVPNLQSGSKVGVLGEAIGTISQDRASGIAGTQGALPKVVPVFVNANDASTGKSMSVRVDVVKDEILLTALVDSAVVNTASLALDRAGGGTARYRFKIAGWDGKKEVLTIARENMYYSTDNILTSLNVELKDALTTLMQNKFEAIDIYGVNVDVELTNEVQVVEVTSVSAPKKKVKPGESVELTVKMKPYRAEEFTQKVLFKVPQDFSGTKLALNVRGGSSVAWIMNLLRKQKQEEAPAAQKREAKRTLRDYVDNLNSADKNNELVIDLASGAQAAAAPANDAGLEGMLKGSPYKQKYPYNFILDGEVEIVLEVAK